MYETSDVWGVFTPLSFHPRFRVISLVLLLCLSQHCIAENNQENLEPSPDMFSSYGTSNAGDRKCRDHAPWCKQLGDRRPVSKCYRRSTSNRCCATCERLRDKDAPEDCAFGDSEVWCSRIGTLYETSSCYKNENTCCKTCNKLRKKDLPGCPFGDHQMWCNDLNSCSMDEATTCCEACHLIKQAELLQLNGLHPVSTITPAHPGSTSLGSSRTTQIPGYNQHNQWDPEDSRHKHRHNHQDNPELPPIGGGVNHGGRPATMAPRLGRINPYELIKLTVQSRTHPVVEQQGMTNDSSVPFIAGIPPPSRDSDGDGGNTRHNNENSRPSSENTRPESGNTRPNGGNQQRPNRHRGNGNKAGRGNNNSDNNNRGDSNRGDSNRGDSNRGDSNRGDSNQGPRFNSDSNNREPERPSRPTKLPRHRSTTPRTLPPPRGGSSNSVLSDTTSGAPPTHRPHGSPRDQDTDSSIPNETSPGGVFPDSEGVNNNRGTPGFENPRRNKPRDTVLLDEDTYDGDDDWEGSSYPEGSLSDDTLLEGTIHSVPRKDNDINQWFHYETDDVIIENPAINQGDIVVAAVDGDIQVYHGDDYPSSSSTSVTSSFWVTMVLMSLVALVTQPCLVTMVIRWSVH